MNKKSEFNFTKWVSIIYGTILFSLLISSILKHEPEEKKSIIDSVISDENEIKNIYLGTSHMGNLKGRAKCEIYKKSNDAILTYEFSGYGIRNEIGEIKIDAGGYGKFECNNGNCNYDILLDDSTLTIIGNNWGCNLKKVSK